MNIRNEINAYIVQEGTTMSEVVRTLSVVHGWSASVPKQSDKLKHGTLRYSEVIELTDVLGYDIIWRKRGERVQSIKTTTSMNCNLQVTKKGDTITISTTYGYIRVSTRDQNEERQLIALWEMSVPEQNIFMDRQISTAPIQAAKARRVKFGRPPKPLPENFHSVYQRWKSKAITGTAAAKECNMPLSTFRYRAKIYEKSKLS